MDEITPETLRDKYKQLGNTWAALQEVEVVKKISADLTTQAKKCEQLKERAYMYIGDLDQRKAELQSEWEALEGNIRQVVQDNHRSLAMLEQETQKFFANMNPNNPHQLEIVGKALEKFEGAIQQVGDKVEELHKQFEQDLSKFTAQIRLVETTLSARDEASFSFDAGEHVYMACSAEWVQNDKDKPNGVLFLTNGRLIFEQKETVGKKLGLFGGKKVQDRLWSVALSQIQSISTERKGLFGGRDMVILTLSPDADYAELVIEVKGAANNKQWQEHIEKMQAQA